VKDASREVHQGLAMKTLGTLLARKLAQSQEVCNRVRTHMMELSTLYT
jgi:hypothetical protein